MHFMPKSTYAFANNAIQAHVLLCKFDERQTSCMGSLFSRLWLVILFTLIYNINYAQENHGYFVIPKFGIYGTPVWEGTAFSIEGGVLRNNTSFAIAYAETKEIFGVEESRGFDLTIGRFIKESSVVYLHAQTGVSALWISKWSAADYRTKTFPVIGLPLKVGIKFKPPAFLSMGIDLQANVNAKQSMMMVMLTLGVWHLNLPKSD